MEMEIPTVEEVEKIKKTLFNDLKVQNYKKHIRSKIFEAVKDGKDKILLYEIKSDLQDEINCISKLLNKSGWCPIQFVRDSMVEIYWSINNKYKKEDQEEDQERKSIDPAWFYLSSYGEDLPGMMDALYTNNYNKLYKIIKECRKKE